MPAALGIWVLVSVFRGWVTLGGFWWRGCRQAGLLAMVMMAGAVRVMVSFAVAWPKLLGDFDLRARCRLRSTMVRYLAISLVSAS